MTQNYAQIVKVAATGMVGRQEDTLNVFLSLGVTFKSTTPKNRSKYVAEGCEGTGMSAASFDKRLGEAVRLARHCGTIEAVKAAVKEYNAARVAKGQAASTSLQIIVAGICGKGHKADKAVKAEAEAVEAETVEAVKAGETLLASMLRNVPNLSMDDRTILIHALQHANDAAAEQNSKILAMV